jgi:hypothetical protein
VTRSERSQTAKQSKRHRSEPELRQLVSRLREALFGLAEREIPGDPLPCFCVEYQLGSGVHDEWCEAARMALAESADISPRLDAASNVSIAALVAHSKPSSSSGR